MFYLPTLLLAVNEATPKNGSNSADAITDY